jgi:hypothetical protein
MGSIRGATGDFCRMVVRLESELRVVQHRSVASIREIKAVLCLAVGHHASDRDGLAREDCQDEWLLVGSVNY